MYQYQARVINSPVVKLSTISSAPHPPVHTQPGFLKPNLSKKQIPVWKKDLPLGNSRTVRQGAPTCSPLFEHSAGNSPLHESGSRQSDRGHHTPGSSRGTCGHESAGVHRNYTGLAAASGIPGKSRKKHQESK